MKKLSLMLLVLFVPAVLWAAGSKDKADSFASIQKKGVIVMGTSADYEPYEYHKAENGKDTIVGFDIELAKVVAEKLGVKLKIEEIDFDGLITALATGKIDMIIAGMNPTTERQKHVDFTESYYVAKQSVLVRKADAGKYKTTADFAGKTVSVQMGTSQEEIAKQTLTSSKLESLIKVPDLVLNLQYNKTDAVVLEDPVAKQYVKVDQNLVILDYEFPSTEESTANAIAFKKNSPEIVAAVNKVIDGMKADGSLQKLIDEWFGKIDN